MREKMQQMLERMKARKGSPAPRGGAHRSDQVAASVEPPRDEWDMSPQDALQVGIVARYK